MGDMLSQAEIDALLNGTSMTSSNSTSFVEQEDLSSQEVDALGEVGNISMGTSATTLFTLLGHKVLITTPKVSVITWDDLSKQYGSQYVAVRVEYTHGLVGSNLLIMNEEDVKIITDLMMGGEGNNTAGELTDLHLSAISEAMNQMVGSSATSMSSMFDKRIDISPPKAFIMQFDSTQPYGDFEGSQKLVKIAFKMEIGNLIDSEIMQLIPIKFAKDLVDNLLNIDVGGPVPSPGPAPQMAPPVQQSWYQQQPQQQYSQPQTQPQGQGGYYQEPQHGGPQMPPQQGYGMGDVEQGGMYF